MIIEIKGKDAVDKASQASNATTINPGMYKLDPVIWAPRDKNNRETRIYYLKHTMKQAAILKEIVEQAKSLNPLDSASYIACKYVKLIQELLGYVRETCPDIHKPSEKLVAVTPMNKVKKVRFSKPLTSSNNITQQCIFDANHDVCFLNVVNETNMRAKSKSKSAKKSTLNNVWKPTGKILTEVGLKWKPTGRTFTLVGNLFPLTRITSNKVVPRKDTTPHSVETQKLELIVYSRRPKQVKTIGSSKKAKIVESTMLQLFHRRLLLLMTGCLDFSMVSGLWMFKTYDRRSLSAHQFRLQVSRYGQVRQRPDCKDYGIW
nr:hypothetical protein [Tanacetum cinerariifolium]